MNRPPRLICRLRCLTVPLLAGVVLFYVGFHALHGDHGLIGRAIEMRKQVQLQEQLAEVRLQREALEHKISLLGGSAIDADLLGEMARKQLPVAGKREIILIK